jgi:hypothetical protein
MNLMDLRRTFSIIVRERKKELDPMMDKQVNPTEDLKTLM